MLTFIQESAKHPPCIIYCVTMRCYIIGVFSVLFWITGSAAADSITVDLPVRAFTKLPSHLAAVPQQITSPDGLGYVVFSVLPATSEEGLFATIVFREDGKEGLAVFWSGEGDQQTTLSENLAEGVTGLNQRTIAIPQALLSEAGKLVISGDQGKILKVRLDWVPVSPVYVAADQSPVAFVGGDRLQASSELTGVPPAGLPDTWFGSVLDAPLQENAEKLEGSVEFTVPLSSVVSQVLLRMKLLGLPLDQSVNVWVNGQSAGSVQPSAPPLTDVGYIADNQGAISYAGWRAGAILLPSNLLKEGENSIQIESKANGVFLRDATLQLRTPVQNTDTVTSETTSTGPASQTTGN